MSPLVVYMDIWRWNSMNDESGRLIADITETWNLEQLEGFLAAIDFEKAFGWLLFITQNVHSSYFASILVRA